MPQLDSLFFTFLKIRQFSPSIIWPQRADLAVLAMAVLLFFREQSNDMLLAAGGCVRKKFGVHPKPLAGT